MWHEWVTLIFGRTGPGYVLFVLPIFTSRRLAGAIPFAPQARRVLIAFALGLIAQAMRAILLANPIAATFVVVAPVGQGGLVPRLRR
jgi:hypothetical protein